MTLFNATQIESATGWSVAHYATLGSTNSEAARLRDEGAPPRLVLVADTQTAGRGREGRSFLSPQGGLYASLLVTPRRLEDVASMVALAAVSVSDALLDLDAHDVSIKWPNDLLLGGKKVGGLLLERSGSDPRVIVGFGINLGALPGGLPASVAARTTALVVDAVAHREGDPACDPRSRLLIRILRNWDRRQRAIDLAPRGTESLYEAWRDRMAFMGEPVRFQLAGEAMEGLLEQVDLKRGLLIRDALGTPRWHQGHLVSELRPQSWAP